MSISLSFAFVKVGMELIHAGYTDSGLDRVARSPFRNQTLYPIRERLSLDWMQAFRGAECVIDKTYCQMPLQSTSTPLRQDDLNPTNRVVKGSPHCGLWFRCPLQIGKSRASTLQTRKVEIFV